MVTASYFFKQRNSLPSLISGKREKIVVFQEEKLHLIPIASSVEPARPSPVTVESLDVITKTSEAVRDPIQPKLLSLTESDDDSRGSEDKLHLVPIASSVEPARPSPVTVESLDVITKTSEAVRDPIQPKLLSLTESDDDSRGSEDKLHLVPIASSVEPARPSPVTVESLDVITKTSEAVRDPIQPKLLSLTESDDDSRGSEDKLHLVPIASSVEPARPSPVTVESLDVITKTSEAVRDPIQPKLLSLTESDDDSRGSEDKLHLVPIASSVEPARPSPVTVESLDVITKTSEAVRDPIQPKLLSLTESDDDSHGSEKLISLFLLILMRL